jgi:hypothetical protein
MTSLRLINLSEITALEPFTSSHKHDVAVQSCTDEDDDSVTLAHTDGTVLAFSEPNQTAEIAWKCDDGDHITAIAWFYVTTKLSILMTGFQSGMIRVFDRVCQRLTRTSQLQSCELMRHIVLNRLATLYFHSIFIVAVL